MVGRMGGPKLSHSFDMLRVATRFANTIQLMKWRFESFLLYFEVFFVGSLALCWRLEKKFSYISHTFFPFSAGDSKDVTAYRREHPQSPSHPNTYSSNVLEERGSGIVRRGDGVSVPSPETEA